MPVIRARSIVVVLFSGLLLAVSCTSTPAAEDLAAPMDEGGEAGGPSTSTTTSHDEVSQETASTGQVESTTRTNHVEDPVITTGLVPKSTDIPVGSDAVTNLTLNGTQVEFTTSLEFTNPRWFSETSFGNDAKTVWGHVSIHNIQRDLAGAEAHNLVDGREALRLQYLTESSDNPYHVTVSVDSWWVDIVLYARDSSLQDALREEFLAGLRITERDGDLPLVQDAGGWLHEFDWVIVAAEQSGFMLAIDPSCDPAEPTCKPDVGSLFPGWDATGNILGVHPNRARSEREMAYPADFVVTIVDLGPIGDLVSCAGFPAFDPLLLSEGLRFDGVTEETQTYTGLKGWDRRYQPGIETWFIGTPERPEVVATYVRNDNGTWNTTSVLACE